MYNYRQDKKAYLSFEEYKKNKNQRGQRYETKKKNKNVKYIYMRIFQFMK